MKYGVLNTALCNTITIKEIPNIVLQAQTYNAHITNFAGIYASSPDSTKDLAIRS